MSVLLSQCILNLTLSQPGLLSLQPTLEDFPMDTFDIQGKNRIVTNAK
jgi:hypothetical protein